MKPGSTITFAGRLRITEARRTDWPHFARWHYRSPHLAALKFGTLLWHGETPAAICLFTSPAMNLARRNDYARTHNLPDLIVGRFTTEGAKRLNQRIVCLSRIVTDPRYRGSGVTTDFVRRSCELCRFPFIECIAAMGRYSRFLEFAGFERVGDCVQRNRPRNSIYSCESTPESITKSRGQTPIYFIRDNRTRQTHAQVKT